MLIAVAAALDVEGPTDRVRSCTPSEGKGEGVGRQVGFIRSLVHNVLCAASGPGPEDASAAWFIQIDWDKAYHRAASGGMRRKR